MQEQSTRDALLERYNTLKRRDAGLAPESRSVIFKAFERTLGRHLPLNKEARILDVGCGEGAVLEFLTHHGYCNLSGFDISPENVEICHRRGLSFVQQYDALDLAGPGDYDLIFCLDLIEHLPKERVLSFLRGLRSKLAQGGMVVLQTPNMGSLWGLYHRYDDLTYEYGPTENSAVDVLTAAGFREEQIHVLPSWSATPWLGHLRELYLSIVHKLLFLAEGSGRPRIPTRNLLITARK